jgi:hypothetical protein
MKLPIKPIEKVHIVFRNDPSVGLRSTSFDAEIYIDLVDFGFETEKENQDYLNDIRAKFAAIYYELEGEQFKPIVWFDYELDEVKEWVENLE